MPSVEITTPFPSIEETAERAGVPPARAREIVDLAQGILHKARRAGQGAVRHRAAKKARGTRKRGAKRATAKR